MKPDEKDAVISALQAALESFGKSMNELKKERDEAREDLAATKHYLTKERDDALAQIVQAECRAERFCQERDEAREENAKMREIAERAIDYLDQSYRGGFRDEANDLRYEIKQLKEATK